MKIRVLGCYGGEMPGYRTSCFLVNGTVVFDAGAITSSLTLKEQARIDVVLLSHSHIDHLKDIGFLADNVFGRRKGPICLVSIREVLDSVKKHFFNGKLWPDFTAIPDKKNPIFTLVPLEPMTPKKINGLTVKAVKVSHTVDAVGFIVNDGKASVVYSGDTGPTDLLWQEANKNKNLRGVLVETSFPNSMTEFSTRVGHLSPRTLETEITKINSHRIPIYVHHLKPQYTDTLVKEIKAIAHPYITVLTQGMVLSL